MKLLYKSDLLSLKQCARKLWLEHNRLDLIPVDDSVLVRRRVDGEIVNEKARAILGEDFIWPTSDDDTDLACQQACALLNENPTRPAVEVPMMREGLYARADALVPEGNGRVLRETKAKSFPFNEKDNTPGKAEEHHLYDVAIQAWVMETSGFTLARAELNLLDNQWRYGGDGNYSTLFRQLDVSLEIEPLMQQVATDCENARTVLAGDMPQLMTGKQCEKPHPCPFQEFCKTLEPAGVEDPIELLPGSDGKGLARKLKKVKGYTSILEPKPDELTGKNAERFKRIQRAHQTKEPVFELGSEVLLESLKYPRYYLDFEGIDLAVPRWQGVRPYEQVPFQWSCHIEQAPGQFTHAEFLDLTGNDPSLHCIEKLEEVIRPEESGPIFVYDAKYEKGRLKEFALRHPSHADSMQKYIDRVNDLLDLVKDYYYHPLMRGSFSIKKVLPVIAPDLDYKLLDQVQEGPAAQVAYLYSAFDSKLSAEKKAEMERNLRKYCRLDTWAMVEVAYFLARKARPTRPAGM